MNTILIIVSLYGGIVTIPMKSENACEAATRRINPLLRWAVAYCIRQPE